MKIKHINIIVIGLVGILALSACGGRKKKGEISKTRMFFHNLTSKYNGYFNADELMDFTQLALSEVHHDNYNQILDVYSYVDIENPKQVAADLDKAIEKVTTVASLHRPSHWLDDCYVLMGKAQYLKHDYESAQETFEYFAEEFDPRNPFGSNFHKKKKTKKELKRQRAADKKDKEKTRKEEQKAKKKARARKKKSKKKKGRRLTKREKEALAAEEKLELETKKVEKELEAENEKNKEKKETEEEAKKPGMFKHKPVYNDGLLWLAKTYITRKRWSDAKSILVKIEGNKYYKPDALQKEITITYADLNLKLKNYNEAIPYLTEALELTKDKKEKARYNYILAQLYEKKKEYSYARVFYEKVKKLHPGYEMEFNSILNLYKTDMLSGAKTSDQIVSKLKKMINEEKNKDYNDQLYYTLGKLELHKGNIAEAIAYFKQATKASTNNKLQQAESYYSLAGLYFDKEDYYNASMYFDSTQNTMAKRDDRYNEVEKLSRNLKGIARNSDIIILQDSLLMVSNWSKERLNEYAKDILKKEEKRKVEAPTKRDRFDRLNNAIPIGLSAGTSSFFAYHPNQVEKGKIDFKRKWGERNLEDNWRRAEKFEVGDGNDEEETEEKEETDEVSDAEINRALKNIPLSASDKSKANSKLEKALYELGTLYKDNLDNCQKSIEILQRLMKDYPKSEHRVEAAYYLYLCSKSSKASLASQYANIIKSEFPDSKYAKFLTDPNFLANYLSADEEAGRFYDQTYTMFQSGNYQAAQSNIVAATKKYGKKYKYKAKFALLEAMIKGKLESKEAYVKALKTLVSKYPKTPEKTRAQEILRFLKGDKYAFNEGLSAEKIEKFNLQDNRMHYIIVQLSAANQKINTDKIKIAISDFNKKYYKLDKLKTKDSYLDIQTKTSLILIRRFANKKKSMDYYDTVQKNKKDFMPSGADFKIFAVTQRNYREVLKQKSTTVYEQFFEENYIKQ